MYTVVCDLVFVLIINHFSSPLHSISTHTLFSTHSEHALPTSSYDRLCLYTDAPPPSPAFCTCRLRRLRELMSDSRYNIDAYIVPMGDEHQSEYVSPHDARIGFISGFSGSSGQSRGIR